MSLKMRVPSRFEDSPFFSPHTSYPYFLSVKTCDSFASVCYLFTYLLIKILLVINSKLGCTCKVKLLLWSYFRQWNSRCDVSKLLTCISFTKTLERHKKLKSKKKMASSFLKKLELLLMKYHQSIKTDPHC